MSGRAVSGVVVAAVGSEFRGDDGAGPAVARRVAELAPAVVDVGTVGEPLDLLGRWDGAELAVVVDAMRSGATPGTVAVVDLDADPDAVGATSTHAIGLARVLRLGRAVGRAPRRVVVVGVEGYDFGPGTRLSPAVAAAVPAAAAMVVALMSEASP